MWKYNSPIGPIYIKYIPEENLYGMYHSGTCWEACNTPQEEADNIYSQCTGCSEWDSLKDISGCPTDLSGWEHC